MLLCTEGDTASQLLRPNGDKSMRLSACDNKRIFAPTPTISDMYGEKKTPLTPLPHFLEENDKSLVATVSRSLQTAVNAKDASNDPATGTLDMLGKCAAIKAHLERNSNRNPAAVRRLMGVLCHLLDMVDNTKIVVR